MKTRYDFFCFFGIIQIPTLPKANDIHSKNKDGDKQNLKTALQRLNFGFTGTCSISRAEQVTNTEMLLKMYKNKEFLYI